MKHPSNEEWIDFLYGEMQPQQRHALESHREKCSKCRSQLEQWSNVGSSLDQWKALPRFKRAASQAVPPLWKAAAVLLIGFSFFLGRQTGSRTIDKAALLTELSPQIRKEIHNTLETHPSLIELVENNRTEEWSEIRSEVQELLQNQTIQSVAAIEQLRQETSAVMDRFHTQLETVALVAEGRYQRSQNQLSSLVAFPQYQATPIAIQHPLNR